MELDLGNRLKQARDAKELSLEDVQQVTKIQKRYLQAIENGDHSVLPGTFYARAFIREYAAAVGLDPDIIMEEHKSELPSSSEDSTITYSRMQRAKEQSSSGGGGGFSKLFPTIITIFLVIVILFALWFFLRELNSGAEKNNQPNDGDSGDEFIIDDSVGEENQGGTSDSGQEQASDDKNNKEEQNKNEKSDNKETSPEEEKPEMSIKVTETGSGSFPQHTLEVSNADKINLSIELAGESYLEVKQSADGEPIIPSANYGKSDSPIEVDLSGKKQFYLKVGYTPATKIKINGKAVEYPLPPQDNMSQKLLFNVTE
ncbi:helix-turn-helix domain-containing protein [Thalassobacillus pellis]|uniref:helix-turn-helix domain-containing protein n=1 Tax=Thalassobacillus pellis TaxID=748008 RepID=UPI001960FB65|nr:helix-turn-helix domain-containing protein [Thalassobacillus pellis]MBM7552681.1 cytoskeletal protein RodZ [Thalassobacillus pellis]